MQYKQMLFWYVLLQIQFWIIVIIIMFLITSLLRYLAFIDIIQDLNVISMFERRVLFMLINP